MKRSVFLSVILLFLLSSCVVTQKINLNDSSAQSRLEAKDFMVSILEDLSCWNGSENGDAFLDVAVSSVAKGLANSDFSRYVYINKATDGSYVISFGFYDLLSLVNQLCQDDSQSILSIEKESDYTALSVCLSMDNYETLKKIIPLLSDPNFEAYGPVYNNPPYDYRTEEDYLYMMEFIFGEESRVIADSTVSIEIETPSPIMETSGRVISDSSVVFEFRLMDFLLLHEPITFYCKY